MHIRAHTHARAHTHRFALACTHGRRCDMYIYSRSLLSYSRSLLPGGLAHSGLLVCKELLYFRSLLSYSRSLLSYSRCLHARMADDAQRWVSFDTKGLF